MTGFELSIDTENAAFHPGPEFETARILRQVARRLEEGHKDGACLDANGNAVGTFKIVHVVPMHQSRGSKRGRRPAQSAATRGR